MTAVHTRLAGVTAHLPEATMTTLELEDRLAARNPGLELPRGVIRNGSGVRRRHLAPPHERPSDLAVHAGRALLAEQGLHARDLDLILYAGVSIDLVEPATAHIVAAKLGAGCPVFDVRNACNSVLNAIQVAQALIAAGRHRRVLICCGELPTAFMPWTLSDADEFLTVGAAYTVSDAGAALLLEAAAEPGVLGHRFAAQSGGWDAATVPMLNLTSDPAAEWPVVRPLTVDAVKLVRGIEATDHAVFTDPLAALGLTWDDFAVVCVHQASLPALWKFCDHVGIPQGKVVVTIVQHGNLVAATLPVQLAQAVAAGRVRRGDLVALVGLASGFSAGIVVVRW
ncbi:3-oxoacyl-ACP synthase III family protein [Nonomuraea sp. SBT364]|uniref:3-oxoacyl-ACP synthase III family protein n=1 Tax=Nonomuraea sp. SBT364 TaxID=1580530 RepID=UPI00066ED2CA|nr:3-oxoacyl-[acyl-carrier-protein] synthase III C-terminal domain-containing protein [Nonomuraea sp. SBT364]